MQQQQQQQDPAASGITFGANLIRDPLEKTAAAAAVGDGHQQQPVKGLLSVDLRIFTLPWVVLICSSKKLLMGCNTQ